MHGPCLDCGTDKEGGERGGADKLKTKTTQPLTPLPRCLFDLALLPNQARLDLNTMEKYKYNDIGESQANHKRKTQ